MMDTDLVITLLANAGVGGALAWKLIELYQREVKEMSSAMSGMATNIILLNQNISDLTTEIRKASRCNGKLRAPRPLPQSPPASSS